MTLSFAGLLGAAWHYRAEIKDAVPKVFASIEKLFEKKSATCHIEIHNSPNARIVNPCANTSTATNQAQPKDPEKATPTDQQRSAPKEEKVADAGEKDNLPTSTTVIDGRWPSTEHSSESKPDEALPGGVAPTPTDVGSKRIAKPKPKLKRRYNRDYILQGDEAERFIIYRDRPLCKRNGPMQCFMPPRRGGNIPFRAY